MFIINIFLQKSLYLSQLFPVSICLLHFPSYPFEFLIPPTINLLHILNMFYKIKLTTHTYNEKNKNHLKTNKKTVAGYKSSRDIRFV